MQETVNDVMSKKVVAVLPGDTLEEALNQAYAGVEGISFEGAMYRKDIGRTHRI